MNSLGPKRRRRRPNRGGSAGIIGTGTGACISPLLTSSVGMSTFTRVPFRSDGDAGLFHYDQEARVGDLVTELI